MSYSHGLEKIYSFEVVNPNSVRPIATLPQNDKIQNDGTISLQKSTLLSKKEPSKKETTEAYPHAQSFDFGPKFSDGIRAARLDEPLESLGLTPFALKALQTRGIKTVEELVLFIQDLKGQNLKGLTQFHIDEIKQKLKSELGANPLQKSKKVDWLAYIRALFYSKDAKERAFFLSRFDLDFLYPLKPNEKIEMEKWPSEIRQKALQKMSTFSQDEKNYLQKKIEEITDCLIKPWMEKRNGLATAYEIEERLWMISEPLAEKAFQGVFAFLKPLIFQQFVSLHGNLYAIDSTTANQYLKIVEKAESYFYKPNSTYQLKELASCLEREFMRQWIGFGTHVIKEFLLIYPGFSVGRDKSGNLFITKKKVTL